MQDLRVRFAPSPTGEIHIGNLRTALFNWLFVRRFGGQFILRIEDTDRARSTDEYEQVIIQELEWLGLDYDEGIGVGGDRGPYRQRERLSLYRQYADQLLQQEQAYHCYCTNEELKKMRVQALSESRMPRYDGRCRHLSSEERQKKVEEGRKPVLRFKMPEVDEVLVVKDLVRDEVEFKSSVLDDFVLLKSDGMPTYNYAVVIDDALMEVTHVIRGEDHLSNTPKQMLIYQALGWEPPSFAHLGMILDREGGKLSKRSDDAYAFVSQYRERGYLPEAMVNYLALLGWSPPDEDELLTVEELCQSFSLERVSKSSAIFDLDKLDWINGIYIRQADLKRIASLLRPYLEEAGYLEGDFSEEEYRWFLDFTSLMRDALDNLSQITSRTSFIFERPEPVEHDLLEEEEVQSMFGEMSRALGEIERWEIESVRAALKQAIKELPIGGKRVYLPLRLVLTGESSGPELYAVVYLLGKKESQYRLQRAVQ